MALLSLCQEYVSMGGNYHNFGSNEGVIAPAMATQSLSLLLP